MTEISLVLSVFKEMRDWLLGIDKTNLAHSKEKKTAIKSLYTALCKTKIYFADRKVQPKDRLRERQISLLWFEAASELESIDNHIAEMCFLKGDYWTDPENWKQDEGNKFNISIDEMTKISRELLIN